MNFLGRTISSITRNYLRTSTERNFSSQVRPIGGQLFNGNIWNSLRHSILTTFQGIQSIRHGSTLNQIHRRGGLVIPNRKRKNPLGENKPFARGVVIKTLIKKPKKPNSANRKCVLVRLSTGKEMTAYVPGIGHDLQEHNVVLVKVGRLKDVPGVKIKCVRGKYDLPHVVKKSQ